MESPIIKRCIDLQLLTTYWLSHHTQHWHQQQAAVNDTNHRHQLHLNGHFLDESESSDSLGFLPPFHTVENLWQQPVLVLYRPDVTDRPGALTTPSPTRAVILSESLPPSTAIPSCCITWHMALQASYRPAADEPPSLAAGHIQLALHLTSYVDTHTQCHTAWPRLINHTQTWYDWLGYIASYLHNYLAWGMCSKSTIPVKFNRINTRTHTHV